MRLLRGAAGLYERHAHLINFLKEKTKNAKGPMSICQLSKAYVRETGANAFLDTLNHRIYSIRTKIASFVNFDIHTRVRMAFALSGPIDMKFYKELCKNAIVEVDDRMRITKYVGNDNVLKLAGNHSNGIKIKRGYAARRQREAGGRDVESEETGTEEKAKEEVKTTSERKVKEPRMYIEQLADSYSMLTEIRKNKENRGEYTLYNDTGDSYTAVLANDQQEKVNEASDLVQVVKEETLDLDEMETFDTPDLIEPSQSASQLIAPEPPAKAASIDINEILYPLRNVIEILDSPDLSDLKLLLTDKIECYERNIKNVERNRILESFEAILRIIAKHASSTILSDNTIRFKELLFMFRLATDHFEAPDFFPFKKWLNVACDDVRWLNTKVSFDHIRAGIEYGLHHLYA